MKALGSLALLILLVAPVASAQSARRAAPERRADGRTPLTSAQRAIMDAIPDENTPEPESRHYFRSNEWRHDLLQPHLEGLGGAFVGVGSDQNYTMAAMARSEMLFLVDFDPRIPWVHDIYRVLVSASETPDTLIARFTPENAEASERLLTEGLANHPRLRQIVRHYRSCRSAWLTYLQRVQRLERNGTRWSWLGRPELYDHVRVLHRAGRVVSRNADVTGAQTMRAVGDAARRLGVTVRAVYFSNAEQFFRFTAGFRENMHALPTDARTIVLRTMRHQHLPRAANDEWHYIVHDFPDYLERLDSRAYGVSFAFVPDIVAAGPASTEGISHITRDTRRVMIEWRERRRAQAASAEPAVARAP